jgi:hypothetical protein
MKVSREWSSRYVFLTIIETSESKPAMLNVAGEDLVIANES